jgi:isopentenyl-diphosphate delta-isomerase
MLWDWGVPTAASTHWLAGMGFEVVAAGGIRNGLDVARALSLGARLTGVAAPLVRAYYSAENGVESVSEFFVELIQGLRSVMLLCGVKRPGELASVPKVIGPDLMRWMALGETA